MQAISSIAAQQTQQSGIVCKDSLSSAASSDVHVLAACNDCSSKHGMVLNRSITIRQEQLECDTAAAAGQCSQVDPGYVMMINGSTGAFFFGPHYRMFAAK